MEPPTSPPARTLNDYLYLSGAKRQVDRYIDLVSCARIGVKGRGAN